MSHLAEVPRGAGEYPRGLLMPAVRKRRGTAAATAKAMAETREAMAADAAPLQPALLPEAAPAGGPRGRGRPAGAINRKTADFIRYLGASGLQLPGVHLARAYSASIEEMLQELGLENTADNRRWAAERQDEAARALLPYVHERRPVAVQVSGDRPIAIVMGVELGDGSGETATEDELEGTVLTLLGGEVVEVGNEEDQGVSDGEASDV